MEGEELRGGGVEGKEEVGVEGGKYVTGGEGLGREELLARQAERGERVGRA